MSQFLTSLSRLSSAEDFLCALEIEHDPKVVSVNRLHIMKRFHDYLRKAGLPGKDMSDDALRLAYRGWLERAYEDFTKSDAVTEKVFKVFRDAQAPAGGGFVPLTSLGKL